MTMETKTRPWWRPSIKLSDNLALITGIVMGVMAAVLMGYFFVQLPSKGICGISHPYNLINWLSNKAFGTDFTLESSFVLFPVLTPIGFIIGSFIAARRNKEFKFRRGPVRDNVLAFILGFLIINFGLLWGSCPLGTTVLAAYGELWAIVIMACIVLGVVVGCEYIKWKVRRAR